MSRIKIEITEHCEFDEAPKELEANSLNEAEFFYIIFKIADRFHQINDIQLTQLRNISKSL